MIQQSTVNACVKAYYGSNEDTDYGKIQAVLRAYEAMREPNTAAPGVGGSPFGDERWVAVKPTGAPYYGIHTESGATVAGTSSGLSEQDAKHICGLHNNELCEADDLIRSLGFDPTRFRSEGGRINYYRLAAAIRHPEDYDGLALSTRPAESVAQGGEELPDDATNLEVIEFFIRVGRTMKPVGHWPGERLYAAIERVLNTPRQFIAEADKVPYRGHNGRGGDEDPTLPPFTPTPATGSGGGAEHRNASACDDLATKEVLVPCDCGCGRQCCAMCGNDLGFITNISPAPAGGDAGGGDIDDISALQVALFNAVAAYEESVSKFPAPKDKATLRKQARLIREHIAALTAKPGAEGSP